MGKNALIAGRVVTRHGLWRALAAVLMAVPLTVAGYIAAPTALGAGDGLMATAFTFPASEYSGVPATPTIARSESGRTPCATGTLPSLNTDWSLGAAVLSTGSGTCTVDYTLIHAHGYLTMAGTYTGGTTVRTFYSASNDGFSMALTDPTTGATTQVIDNWAVEAAAPSGSFNAIGSMTVKPGLTYDVDVWYFDLQGASSVALAWDQAGVPVAVPDAALSTVRPLTAQPALSTVVASGSPVSLTYPSAVLTTQLDTRGGDGTGATTFAKVSGNCTVSPTGLLTATGSGACVATATKAGDAVFAAATSANFTMNVLIPQAALAVTAPSQLAFGSAATLSTTGGSGTGAVTFAATGPCTVSGAVVTVTSTPSTACTVTATKATDGTYDVATATATIATIKAQQAALTAVVNGPLTYDPVSPASTTISVTGGSGSGAMSYTASGPCTLASQGASGTAVVATGGGACTVVATRASDADYNAESTSVSLTIGTANQPPVTLSSSTLSMTYRASPPATATLTAVGGAGTGTYVFQADVASVGVCSVTTTAGSGTVTALGAGTCKVTAKRLGDANYSDGVSAPVYISVAAQVTTTVLVPSLSLTYGIPIAPVQVVLALGGANPVYTATLPAGLAIDPTTGVVSGTPLAATASAGYAITATDANGSTSSSTVTIVVAPATPTVTWLTQPAATYAYGAQPAAVSAQAVGNATPLVYLTGTPTVCTVATNGQFTVLRGGVCQYSAFVAGDANHNAVTLDGQFTVALVAPSAPSDVALKVENTKLTTSWTPSAEDGGSALQSYTVRATTGGVTSTCTVDATLTTCALTGLTQGSTYSVTVAASNTSVGALAAVSSAQSAAVSAAIPTSQVRFVAGNIASRYDPTPVTSAVDNLSSSAQQVLLDAGIVEAPSEAPVVTITANLSAASFDTPVNLSVPQTVDSGSQVRVRLLVPSDTPSGALVHATLTLPGGGRVDLGTTALRSSDVTGGVLLGAFAIVTPGDYVLSVDILGQATAGPTRALAAAATIVHQSIDYAIRVVAGSSGVPVIAAAPTPTPSETPSESPTPSPEPTISEEPAPVPSPSASVDDRGLVIVNPLDNPTSVAKTAVTAVTLVSAVGAAASAAAAAGAAAGSAASAGGAAGGSAGGGGARSGGGSGGSAGGGSGGAASGSDSAGSDSAGGDDGADSMATVQTVDVEHEVFEDLTVNWGDALPIWSLAGMKYLDRKSHNATVHVAPYSPLLSKLLTDGAYTRALVGIFSAVLPVISVTLAVLGIRANGHVLLPPPPAMLLAIAVIGVLDAAAGALGIGVFAAGMWVMAGVHTKGDVRMVMGLLILGFGPALLAGAFRGYRRPAAMEGRQWWERVVDLGVAPFVGGWATKGMVDALSSLSGVQLPVAQYANQIALAVAGTLMLRVVLEEFAAQYFPARLNSIHPTEVRAPSNVQKSIALAMRAGIFFYIADAFVGTGWYLYVGTLLFILPNYVGLFQEKFPNYPALYQFLPAGLPGLATSLLVASATLSLLTQALGETPNLAKFAFAVLPIPSAILAVMGMLGREPREGDVRWYQRPRFTALYRIGGIAMLVYTIHLAGIF